MCLPSRVGSPYTVCTMLARELRSKYLEFFEKKGALRLPSDSLVTDDPTLLFTVAGMVPFKAYFEDRATPPRTSVTTSQKCLRTNDIDDIGDTSHCTFFEMLGNFSFGDYFKTEAVQWAWEFLTDVLKLSSQDLRVTVYQEDEEAYNLWRACGLPPERITRLGQKTNYWPANAIVEKSQGPCGPCSEIFFDRQPNEPFDIDWNGEGERWLEIWNLVFTQFTGKGEGDEYQLIPLPKKNIDTGMGLDRTAAAINRLAGPFETDLLRPIIARLEVLSGKTYTSTPDGALDIAFRRVADHVRASVFLLSDGVTPDRTGRGYVLRRLMRRAIVAGIRTLGFGDAPFLHEAVPTVVENMGEAYPELREREDYILGQFKQEESLFRRTLQNGLVRLDEQIASGKLDGERAFYLYDTYGLPFEITREIAAERGIVVDAGGYERAAEEARETARASSGLGGTWATGDEAAKEMLKNLPLTRFTGYTQLENNGHILGLLVDGKPAQSVSVEQISDGQTVEVFLNTTPFYAEAGGQVGDTGQIRAANGDLDVTDTKKRNGLYFHLGRVTNGTITVGDSVTAIVDHERRRDVMRNHTATHLLHKALRDKLGNHVQQRGSLVAADRLRFDFAHSTAVSTEDLKAIEAEVNGAILNEMPVEIAEKPISEAREMGAMMLFGEKYGDVVRVVSVGGDFSREFCGGTHVGNASQIGPFRLLSEGSAAAGVRRIEALTGRAAEAHDAQSTETLKQAAQLLGVKPSDVPTALEKLQTELKAAKQAIIQAKQAQAGGQAQELVNGAQQIGAFRVVVAAPTVDDSAALSALADDVLGRLQSGVVTLGASANGKVVFVVKASKDAVAKGAHAGEAVKAAAQTAGGGGGGRPDFAQAGGRDATKVKEALAAAQAVLARQLG